MVLVWWHAEPSLIWCVLLLRIRLEVEFDKYSIGEADSIHKLVWGTESCGRAAVVYRQASVNGMRYSDCEMRGVQ